MAKKRRITAPSRVTKTRSVKKTAAKKPAPPKTPMPLPSVFDVVAQIFRLFRNQWRTLLGIVAVYLLLNIIFASGLSNLNSAVEDIKYNLSNSATTEHPLAKALTGFGSLVGSAGVSGSSSGSILQSALFVIESLVIIWTLRHLMAGKPVGVKEAYYSSTYPLIPFVLVLAVIIIQLLPISFGITALAAVLTSAFSNVTLAFWVALPLSVILTAWSIYMITGSIFALYIVTLPDMQPRHALRSAKHLVHRRRLAVFPRLLFLPVFLLTVMAIIIMPLIIFASFLVAPVFYILSMLSILFTHAYIYTLYRRLLH